MNNRGGQRADELPPLDPEVAAPLHEIPDEALPSALWDFDDIPSSRERMREMGGMATGEQGGREGIESEDILVPGPTEGQDLRLRVYRPVGEEDVLPCIYFIHGGGMIAGRVEDTDDQCDRFADELGSVVVSVDYRLAPEHPYPAPVDDCETGLGWVIDHPEALGINPDRVAVVGGSAGGGLAAAVCLRERDDEERSIHFLMLQSPMLDDRNITDSSKQLTDIGVWDRDMNTQAWNAFLGELSDTDDIPIDASPGRAEDLSGLPPAYLDVGTHDVFRDETMGFARRLLESGVPAELHVWPGCYHGFRGLAPEARVSKDTDRTQLAALRRALQD